MLSYVDSAARILVDDFADPYVDTDEWRQAPVPHRYVHGGFTGSETRFSIYFPPAELYQGRFFQHITPVPESEYLAQSATGQEDKIGFAFGVGAYFLETNGGGASGVPGTDIDPTIAGYRANAACAEYSRVVAQKVYGEHRPYGYAYGGSGGAYRTIGGAENTVGVWDGVVPYVLGSPMAIPSVFSVRMHAQRVLRDKLDQIVDAIEPGGGGDPYAGLNEEERAALLEVTRMGFPLRSWFGHRTMGTQAFGRIFPHLVAVDPAYFSDFWSAPGYLGADPDSSVHRDRVRLRCEVSEIVPRGDGVERVRPGPGGGVDESFKAVVVDRDTVVAVRLAQVPAVDLQTAEMVVCSGDAQGTRVVLTGIQGDLAVVDFPDLQPALSKLRPGDIVEIDNSNVLAAQTYHRHQVPGPEYAVWDQFRGPDGIPTYPQRPFLVGPMFNAAAAGHVATGRFHGKMIVVESLLDREAFPWQADWYKARVAEHLSADIDQHFRLWYVDNALHADAEVQENPSHTVSYVGVLHEALRQLSAWVETGVSPSSSTCYAVEDGQVVIPGNATERLGIQPVVTLTVDAGPRTDVETGAEFLLEAVAEVPPGAGTVVRLQWDLDGDGVFELDEVVAPQSTQVVVRRRYSYPTPGTHFVTVRVSSHHNGDPNTSFARIDNLARVRVVTH